MVLAVVVVVVAVVAMVAPQTFRLPCLAPQQPRHAQQPPRCLRLRLPRAVVVCPASWGWMTRWRA